MKTHRFLKYLCVLTLFVGLATALTSCDDWDDDWGWDDDDYDWDTFNDPQFRGCWVLTWANNQPVTNLDTNWLYFNGDGRGTYYYYDDGYEETEPIRYNCQYSVSGNTRYQINLQYGMDTPITMNYRFEGDSLILRWWSSYGRQEYVYERTGEIPW